jgi:hypothetical protein
MRQRRKTPLWVRQMMADLREELIVKPMGRVIAMIANGASVDEALARSVVRPVQTEPAR